MSAGAGFVMVTEAEALAVESAALVAVTVTAFGDGGTAGAVWSPAALMVPTALFPPVTPFTAQVMFLFVEPVTVAVKVDVCPVSREALWGEIETATAGVSIAAGLPPPQPTESTAMNASGRMVADFRRSGKRRPLRALQDRHGS